MPFDIDEARARLADLERSDPARLRDHLAALAQPRLAGTEPAADVERLLRARFEELGYQTREFPFSFSAWPGRFGLTMAGASLALGGVLGAWLIPAGLPGAAIAILLVCLALAVTPLVALGPALDRLPWGRVESRNLLFSPPEGRPTWVLMAHRDSKSQIVPTLVRSGAIALAAVAWLLLLVLAALWIAGDPFRWPGLAIGVGVVLFVAGLILALSWSGNESPGALDNASGLAALLEVASDTRSTGGVAFLVTDGEELGLAGARAVAAHLPPIQGVINVDGLDDHGVFYVAEGYGWQRKGSAPQLAAALLTAATVLDMPVERRRLPRSIPVDHLPVAEAGIPALTLLRGSWRSLLRVHRPSDDVDGLDGSGAAAGATLLRAAIALLRAEQAAHLAGRRGTAS
jgi:hypothetical protein